MLRGWIGYFSLVKAPCVLKELDSWIRRKLRCFIVKRRINNCRTRYGNLVYMGVGF